MPVKNILEITQLKTSFYIKNEWYSAVNNINLSVEEGEILGIVGESGSGKSVLSLSVMQLLPEKIANVEEGEIKFKGKRIDNISEKDYNKIRGKELSMIFQEPMTALNPVFTIGNQLVEKIMLHLKLDKVKSREKAIDLLNQVGIPRAGEVIDNYPHQLSGGMRQRVMIALAISCNPDLLIADEPTTALDVTVQAQILDLLRKIRKENNMSIIFISHDLAVISELCDRVAVMYAGNIIETGTTDEIFQSPKHPYTQALIRSIPKLEGNPEKLEVIEGSVPSLVNMPKQGCKFANRCPHVMDICKKENVPLKLIDAKHKVACHLYDEM
ncbi:ABC transporter ATP-binding protein [Staphylococcus simulans]|uniref:ABC transporter ATP-binding protein n=1 Tax=Staphylococcus simulans TaxID=1286 RepID=UPI003F7E141B